MAKKKSKKDKPTEKKPKKGKKNDAKKAKKKAAKKRAAKKKLAEKTSKKAAKKKSAAKKRHKVEKAPKPDPTDDEISAKAYEIYREREETGETGHPHGDWEKARQILRGDWTR